jgi:hypothetical protein
MTGCRPATCMLDEVLVLDVPPRSSPPPLLHQHRIRSQSPRWRAVTLLLVRSPCQSSPAAPCLWTRRQTWSSSQPPPVRRRCAPPFRPRRRRPLPRCGGLVLLRGFWHPLLRAADVQFSSPVPALPMRRPGWWLLNCRSPVGGLVQIFGSRLVIAIRMRGSYAKFVDQCQHSSGQYLAVGFKSHSPDRFFVP